MEPWSLEKQPSQSLRPSRTLAFLPFGDRSQMISFLAYPRMNWFLSLATSTFLTNFRLHFPALIPSSSTQVFSSFLAVSHEAQSGQ